LGKSLEKASAKLLAEQMKASHEALLLGIITATGGVALFRAGPHLSVSAGLFPGHAEVLSVGKCPPDPVGGFSIYIRNGKLAAFYRNSILNRSKSAFCLPRSDVDDILSMLGSAFEATFQVYPKFKAP
jgi:hypothetical protein